MTTPTDLSEEDLAFLAYLIVDCRYLMAQPNPSDPTRWIALCEYGFTTAIIGGVMGDRITVEQRWCYHDFASALAALLRWDGTGKPDGWHREPHTGLRRRENEDTGEIEEYQAW